MQATQIKQPTENPATAYAFSQPFLEFESAP